MKNKKINYIHSETFQTNKENPTEEELKEIFNRKFFKVVMKIEKSEFIINDKQDNLLKN